MVAENFVFLALRNLQFNTQILSAALSLLNRMTILEDLN